MSLQNKKARADLKVVLLGDTGVGKTCLIIRYIQGSFSSSEEITLGASFFLKQRGPHNIALWDTAGQERFKGLSSFYCRDAGAAILCYNISSSQSLEILKSRYAPLLDDEQTCLKVVVGTKLDMVSPNEDGKIEKSRQVSKEVGREYAKVLNHEFLAKHPDADVPFFETSSKENTNVTELFDYIFSQCLGNLPGDYSVVKEKTDTIKLQEPASTAQSMTNPRQKKCC